MTKRLQLGPVVAGLQSRGVKCVAEFRSARSHFRVVVDRHGYGEASPHRGYGNRRYDCQNTYQNWADPRENAPGTAGVNDVSIHRSPLARRSMSGAAL